MRRKGGWEAVSEQAAPALARQQGTGAPCAVVCSVAQAQHTHSMWPASVSVACVQSSSTREARRTEQTSEKTSYWQAQLHRRDCYCTGSWRGQQPAACCALLLAFCSAGRHEHAMLRNAAFSPLTGVAQGVVQSVQQHAAQHALGCRLVCCAVRVRAYACRTDAENAQGVRNLP